MSYMAEKFGNEQHLVSGWILGNEVDSPYDWNYAGGKSLSAYMDDYARAFRIAYNMLQRVSAAIQRYISALIITGIRMSMEAETAFSRRRIHWNHLFRN